MWCEWQADDAPPPPEYLQGINVSQIVPWFAHFNILQRWAFATGIYNIADLTWGLRSRVSVSCSNICLLIVFGFNLTYYIKRSLFGGFSVSLSLLHPHTTKVVFPNKTVDKLGWPETFHPSHLSTSDSSTHFSKLYSTTVIHQKWWTLKWLLTCCCKDLYDAQDFSIWAGHPSIKVH